MARYQQGERIVCHHLTHGTGSLRMAHCPRKLRISHHLSGSNPGATGENLARERGKSSMSADSAQVPCHPKHAFELSGQVSIIAAPLLPSATPVTLPPWNLRPPNAVRADTNDAEPLPAYNYSLARIIDCMRRKSRKHRSSESDMGSQICMITLAGQANDSHRWVPSFRSFLRWRSHTEA